MRRRVLCGGWARLAFLRAREKKALVVVVAQLAKIERPVNRTPACLPPIEDCSAPGMDTTPGKHGEWRRRAGGASAACLRSA